MSLPNNYVCEGQMSIFDLGIWYGKTSKEPLVPTKERILEQSLRKQQKLSVKMPLFLDLRMENGHQAVASWVMGGPLLGEYMMHSFGECPSEENVSLLSQILEETPHQKYSLSAKACQGILRRAEKRGKILPKMLKEALERQSVSKNEQEKLGGVKESLYSMSEQEPCQHSTTKVYSIGHDIRSARFTDDEITDPLTATDYKDPIKITCPVVRRLTPLECERLQGYPDHWTDIGEWTDSKGKLRKDSDTPRYKALGNSIALPFWAWMAKRMVQHLDADKPTMASLFDGISGFPLVYARAGVETKWTSEIEEFPIAVCKKHFGDEDTGEVGDYEKYL